MATRLDGGGIRAQAEDLAGSQFRDVNLSASKAFS